MFVILRSVIYNHIKIMFVILPHFGDIKVVILLNVLKSTIMFPVRVFCSSIGCNSVGYKHFFCFFMLYLKVN